MKYKCAPVFGTAKNCTYFHSNNNERPSRMANGMQLI